MKCISPLLLFFSFINFGFSQTFKRWPNGKLEMTNKELSYQQKANIFNDFKWTYPTIKSIPIVFTNKNASFDVAGKRFSVAIVSDKKMSLISLNGNSSESDEQISEGNMYYDKAALHYKAVTVSSWTSYTTYTNQSVSVSRTRSVPVITWVNGKSSTSYRSESYTTIEYRSVPHTEQRYTPHTTYVLDIPKYPFYAFKFNDSISFVIYKADKEKYYLQNASYLIAKDKDGINHIFIDANCNGDFLDEGDKVMFNSWDPYSKTSSYRSAGMFKENNWYDLSFLQINNFLSFSKDPVNGKLKIDYENSGFSDDEDKGKVTIENIPDDADLFVNGKKYHDKKGTKTYKTQFGKFIVKISKEGFLDYETTYYVDKENPITSIKYQTPREASNVEIENIFQKSYFVTVSDSLGYNHTYSNTPRCRIPAGNTNVSIYSDGFTLNKQLSTKAGDKTIIDFEAEVKKLKVDEKEAKPNSDVEDKKIDNER